MQCKGIAESLAISWEKRVYPDRKSVADFVSGEVYRDPRKYGFDTEDDAADALLRYRKRLDVLVDRYLELGSTHAHFIETGLKYMAKSIRREKRKDSEREYVCECPDVWCSGGSLPALGAEYFRTRPESECRSDVDRDTDEILAHAGARGRRIVYLFLKCIPASEGMDLDSVAANAGVPADWLAGLVARIRFRMEGERVRFGAIAETRNVAWSRMYTLEVRLSRELDPEKRAALGCRLVRQRARYDLIRARAERIIQKVPNSIIAEIVGVPKGTIDSGLYYLKKTPVPVLRR